MPPRRPAPGRWRAIIGPMAYGPAYHRVSFGPRITRIVKYLVVANVLVFLWQRLAGFEIIRIFGLTPALVFGKLFLWQFVTYLFLHGDFWHIFLNMFVLWMFGSELERTWGERAFLRYYFITGVGAGLFSALSDPSSLAPTIGASGAVYGILMAYGLMFPNRYVYLYFLFPVKVKYFVAVLGLLAFIATLGSPGSTIAHVAHLGGMVVGFLYLRGWLSFSGVRQAYFRWRLRRMRSKFKVHYGPPRERRKDDDDFWIN
jgi:membrane associated rhomboid family serine protease